MTVEQAGAFLVFAAVAAFTPGPSNVMLAAAGAMVGVVRGLGCLLGVAAGMALMMFAVAFGLGALVLGQPALLVACKAGGAAFLAWLAWKIATAPAGAPAGGASPVGFAGALLFQWLNPKSWLVSVSASAVYLDRGGGALAQAAWIAGLFFAVALVTGFAWLAFGAAMRRFLRTRRAHRAFNVAMGALLAASVLMLLA